MLPPSREFHAHQPTPLARADAFFRRTASARQRRFLGICATLVLVIVALGSALAFLHAAFSRSNNGGVSSGTGTLSGGGASADSPLQPASFPLRPAAVFMEPGAPISLADESDDEVLYMRQMVRNAMIHSWDGYKQFAWGSDELAPPYRRGKHGAAPGATIVDAMSTLKIMGLESRYLDAVNWVKQFDFRSGGKVSFFETTIRDLGGLLSAHDLSADPALLAQAVKVGDGLMGAFTGTNASNPANPIPFAQVNLETHEAEAGWLGSNSLLAEMGTIQLEMRQLSHYTGVQTYADAADRISRILQMKQPESPAGLWNTYIDRASAEDGSPTLFTFGAMSDSAYEYLLKGWLQTGKREEWLWDMYASAIDGMHTQLLQTSCPDMWWVADLKEDGRLDHKMDHLACFLPGLLALGVAHRPDAPNAGRDLHTAEKLLDTCVKMYTDQPTGLAPEFTRFKANTCSMEPGQLLSLQRPETVESLMYMWRVTKQQKWRDAGRAIMLAFEACCKTETGGYTGLKDVKTGEQDHTQQSWWLAETLKYLYLLFSPDKVVPLDLYVFNTEAHPILTWPMSNDNQEGGSTTARRYMDGAKETH